MKLRLSRTANAEIGTIALGWRTDSRQAAQRFVNLVDRTLQRLSTFPESGVMRHDINDLRMMSLLPFVYLLFYRIEANEILVVRVIDGRRDVKAVLNDE